MHSIQHRESLIGVAKQVGIAVPDDTSNDAKYPHWRLFCMIQLERPINSDDALLHNAKVIAAIPKNKIRSIVFGDISNLLK